MPLISVSELSGRLSSPRLKLFDARASLTDPTYAAAAYAQGHIAGAQRLDLDTDLSGSKSDPCSGRHPLPSEDEWRTVIERAGVAPEDAVVVYDQADGSLAAARAWFLFVLAGHADVRVLDGGMNAWLAAGLPVTRDVPAPPASRHPVRYRRELLADIAEVRELVAGRSGKKLLLDARAPERFRGEVEPIDAKAGHIPGAYNRPFFANTVNGLFKSPEALRAEFAPLIEGKSDILLSCGSGVTACHNALALSHAGIRHWRLFAPSWSGWIADPAHPVAAG